MEIWLGLAIVSLSWALAVQSCRLWWTKNLLMDARQDRDDYAEHLGQRVAAETYSVNQKHERLRKAIVELAETHK